MITGEIPGALELLRETEPERPAGGGALRVVLVVAIALLVVGLLVFLALSGLAADPMTGT